MRYPMINNPTYGLSNDRQMIWYSVDCYANKLVPSLTTGKRTDTQSNDKETN
jgi:hypothetical protein